MISGLTDIYNPFSLLNAFSSQMIQDYWFRSGTPSYLVRLLRHTKENLDELTGRYYEPQEFVDYKADVEKPLPMIYQSGYLTIKDYNMRRNTFLLDFPNNEVKNGFLTVVASDYLKPKTSVNAWVQDAVDAFEPGKVHPAANGGGDDDHGNQSGNDPLNRFHLFLLFMTGWRTNGGGAG